MAKTYSQLLKDIEGLKLQAEERRQKELKGVIARIREAIEFYGLSAADLGFKGTASSGGQPRAGAARNAARFRDQSGNTWTGRGPRPRWLREALAAGRTLDEFRAPEGSGTAGKRKSKSRLKGGAKSERVARFMDGAGNSWVGRGKRPRWLTEALAAGKSLDDFKVDAAQGRPAR